MSVDVWMETTEVAKYLRFCRLTILRAARRGELIGYRAPGAKSRWRFKLADVQAFAERHGNRNQQAGA